METLDLNKIDGVCLEEIDGFISANEEFFNNSIVKSFLSSQKYKDLFVETLCNPSIENNEKLDIAFKKYYFNIRFTSYIASALYFNALNFDKRHRKIQKRYLLTIDKSFGEEDLTFKDNIIDSSSTISLNDLIKSENIIDYLEDPLLCEAVNLLTKKQKEILDLAYVKGLSDTEIGKVLDKSQQSVSKTHKKALKRIQYYLQKREEIQS